jgi:hypothetical protein
MTGIEGQFLPFLVPYRDLARACPRLSGFYFQGNDSHLAGEGLRVNRLVMSGIEDDDSTDNNDDSRQDSTYGFEKRRIEAHEFPESSVWMDPLKYSIWSFRRPPVKPTKSFSGKVQFRLDASVSSCLYLLHRNNPKRFEGMIIMASAAILLKTEEVSSAVRSILGGIYGGENSEFATPLDYVPAAIAKILTKEHKTEVETDRLFRNVLNVIWNNYAGGDTAEFATKRIFAALDIPA